MPYSHLLHMPTTSLSALYFLFTKGRYRTFFDPSTVSSFFYFLKRHPDISSRVVDYRYCFGRCSRVLILGIEFHLVVVPAVLVCAFFLSSWAWGCLGGYGFLLRGGGFFLVVYRFLFIGVFRDRLGLLPQAALEVVLLEYLEEVYQLVPNPQQDTSLTSPSSSTLSTKPITSYSYATTFHTFPKVTPPFLYKSL